MSFGACSGWNVRVRLKKGKARLGLLLYWQSVCLVCMKPWVQTPALHKPGLVVHAYEPSTQMDREFKVIFG